MAEGERADATAASGISSDAADASREPSREPTDRASVGPPPYTLRVLDGLHAGAVAALDEGEARIADVVDADVFLSDLDRAWRFDLAGRRLSAVAADGSQISAEVPAIVALDGVRVSIEAKADWLAEADARALEREKERETARAEEDARAAGSKDDTADHAVDAAPASGFARPEQMDADATAPSPQMRRAAARPPLALLLGGALALAGLGLLALGVVAPQRSPDLSAIDVLAEPAAREGRDASAAMRAWLAETAPELRVIGASPRGVRVAGHLSDGARAAFIEAAAARFGRGAIDASAVTSPSRIEAELRRRLEDSDAGRRLDLRSRLEDGVLVLTVSGTLTADQTGFWRDVSAWFEARFSDNARLASEIVTTGRGGVGPPRLALEAVWIGPDPYLYLADGRRLRPGDQIESGWVLSSIDAREIRLSRGERVEVVRLPAARGDQVEETGRLDETIAEGDAR